jgi:hypothetical protein
MTSKNRCARKKGPLIIAILLPLIAVILVLFFTRSPGPPVPMRSFQITTNLTYSLRGQMVLLPNGTLCASYDNKIVGIDPTDPNGRELWSADLTGMGLVPWPDLIAGPDNSIYAFVITGINSGFIVNVRDGNVLSQHPYSSGALVPRSTPLPLPDGSICLGTREGILTLNADGSEKWRFPTQSVQYRPPSLAPDGGFF